MRKKIFAVALCLLMVMMLPMSVLAAQETNLIQSVQIEGPRMTMICSGVAGVHGKYEVTIDGQRVSVNNSTAHASQVPMTFFCMVDTSGSISDYKMRLIRETLFAISESLGPKDNMVIARLGNELEVGGILNQPGEREAAINSLQATREDTNLYAGIVESVRKLTSDTNYHDLGCVVVLSDGKDCQDNGMTESEVMNAVQESRVPLFTVALVQSQDECEDAKIMGSFARGSFGGIHQSTVSEEGGNKPIRWDVNGAEFGRNVMRVMHTMSVLSGDLTELNVDDRQTEVRVDVKLINGSSVFTDTYKMNVDAFADIHPEIEEEPQEEGTDAVQVWTVIGIVLIVLAVLLLIVSKVRSKKKNQAAKEETQEDAQESVTGVPDQVQVPVVPEIPEIPDSAFARQRYVVHLTDIPYGTQKRTFTVNAVEVATFGRDPRRAQCVISTSDHQLSGKHFSLTLQKAHYCIRDEESKNGTYHNGVPIAGKGWVKLASGDRVRAGAYEYRIVIEPEK